MILRMWRACVTVNSWWYVLHVQVFRNRSRMLAFTITCLVDDPIFVSKGLGVNKSCSLVARLHELGSSIQDLVAQLEAHRMGRRERSIAPAPRLYKLTTIPARRSLGVKGLMNRKHCTTRCSVQTS